MTSKVQIAQELELAKMMASDIDKLYAKYQKAAIKAETERLQKVIDKTYKGCNSAQELQDAYGYGGITEDEYREGIEFFEALNTRSSQLSVIELHRKNLKDIRDRWRGTIKELQSELDELNGVVTDKLSYVEKLEAAERSERYRNMY